MAVVVTLDRAVSRLLAAVAVTTALSLLPAPWGRLAWLSGAWAVACLVRVERVGRRF